MPSLESAKISTIRYSFVCLSYSPLWYRVPRLVVYDKKASSKFLLVTEYPSPYHSSGNGQNCTRCVRQPSQIRFVPVMKLARGLAKNTTAFATSSGVPIRPIGERAKAG